MYDLTGGRAGSGTRFEGWCYLVMGRRGGGHGDIKRVHRVGELVDKGLQVGTQGVIQHLGGADAGWGCGRRCESHPTLHGS